MGEKFGNTQMEGEHPTDEDLSAFVDGAVNGEKLEQTKEHLSNCGACRQVTLDTLDANREIGHDMSDDGSVN